MEPAVSYRISSLTAGCLLTIAALVDSIQIVSSLLLALSAVPFLGLVAGPIGAAFVVISWILSIVALLLFILFFRLKKVPFLSAGGDEGDAMSGVLNTQGAMFGVISESIPFFNIFPIFSIIVGRAIFSSRKSDRKKSRQ